MLEWLVDECALFDRREKTTLRGTGTASSARAMEAVWMTEVMEVVSSDRMCDTRGEEGRGDDSVRLPFIKAEEDESGGDGWYSVRSDVSVGRGSKLR